MPWWCRFVRKPDGEWVHGGAAFRSWNPAVIKCLRLRWHPGAHWNDKPDYASV